MLPAGFTNALTFFCTKNAFHNFTRKVLVRRNHMLYRIDKFSNKNLQTWLVISFQQKKKKKYTKIRRKNFHFKNNTSTDAENAPTSQHIAIVEKTNKHCVCTQNRVPRYRRTLVNTASRFARSAERVYFFRFSRQFNMHTRIPYIRFIVAPWAKQFSFPCDISILATCNLRTTVSLATRFHQKLTFSLRVQGARTYGMCSVSATAFSLISQITASVGRSCIMK